MHRLKISQKDNCDIVEDCVIFRALQNSIIFCCNVRMQNCDIVCHEPIPTLKRLATADSKDSKRGREWSIFIQKSKICPSI